jgi:hypothetical protein
LKLREPRISTLTYSVGGRPVIFHGPFPNDPIDSLFSIPKAEITSADESSEVYESVEYDNKVNSEELKQSMLIKSDFIKCSNLQ